MTQLSVRSLALACALIWGGGIAITALAHLAIPSYGSAFLTFLSSIYPGFHGAHSFADALMGIGYGLVDGGIGGAILAWLYNLLASGHRMPATHD
jgi:hypothetical protein